LTLFLSLRFKRPDFHHHPGRRNPGLTLAPFIIKRKALDILPDALIPYTQRGYLRCMFSDYAACSGSKEGTFAIAEGKMEHICTITKSSQRSELFLGALVTRSHHHLCDISGSAPTHCVPQLRLELHESFCLY